MAIFQSIKQALSKTRSFFSQGTSHLLGRKVLDEETQEEISTLLLKADFGINTTEHLLDRLEQRLKQDGGEVIAALKAELLTMLTASAKPFHLKQNQGPQVVLFLGINGAGKTTSLGKLAHRLKQQRYRPVLAAGDTFRAAATQQLAGWAERTALPLVASQPGADSAAVIFDALQSALAKDYDVVLADTAGRLQNKAHLMDELKKLVRVLQKKEASAPHEVILVLDASIGQNALNQVRDFNAAIPLTGLILTKLDGTAKGGMLFALSEQFKLPIYFLGTGEATEDLIPFDPKAFVNGLFEGD
jgi:fused signal recognition particle receptor